MPKHELASATCITVTPLPTQGRYVPAPAGPHLRRHAPTTVSTQAPTVRDRPDALFDGERFAERLAGRRTAVFSTTTGC